ncbi:hypothetical protein ONZ45_g16009 [Pleurotus djamor]|nr:hypothetical protein ONZ45_g16009 [Pleurotus djamor]
MSQQIRNLLQHLKSLYPFPEKAPHRSLVLDNPWYIVASVAFSASNRPEHVAEVYKFVSEELNSQDDHTLLAINSLIALNDITPKAISESIGTLSRDTSLSLEDYSSSGRQNFENIYGETSGPVQCLLDTIYPDLGWFSRTIGYGVVYGHHSVLSPIETSYVLVTSIIANDTPKQINWHLAGARRQGASLEEVKAVRQIAVEAAAFSGITWREGVPEVTESVSEHVGLSIFISSSLLVLPFLSRPASHRTKAEFRTHSHANVHVRSDSPSEEWKDNVWPYRQPMPWDISTDYPYKRALEYDVTEGTWLRLDVHPVTGDIVFDMVGDLYCLPASSYLSGSFDVTRAVPILRGVPFDSDPHFSPDGTRLAWRSDAGLGVENIWVTSWTGCEDMDLRPTIPSRASPELVAALDFQHEDETLLAERVRETPERRDRRLVREGRFAARRVTNETYRWVSDPRFHPSGSKVIATKWYTSSRSLGAGESWEYALSSDDSHIPVESGTRRVGRTLPPGWDTASDYGDQQVGPEQAIWHGHDTLIYSKNVADEGNGAFEYSKDVHKGIYAIFSYNLTTKATKTIVSASPGGASRPELSRDGKTLAFIRRVRDKSVLVLKDLTTGTINYVFDGLTYDLTTVSAPMGTYPSFAFTPSSAAEEAVIIWGAGQIWYIPLAKNARGERVKHPSNPPRIIPFKATIEKRVSETLVADTNDGKKGIIEGLDLVGLETQTTTRVRAMKELKVDQHGKRVVFQAAGVSYTHETGISAAPKPRKVPVLQPEFPYYSPSFIPGLDALVIHGRWSDVSFSTFEIADLQGDCAYEVTGLPMGRYYSPVVSAPSASRHLAFVKTGGGILTGNIVATGNPGIYVADINVPHSEECSGGDIEVTHTRFITDNLELDEEEVIKVRWVTPEEPKSLFPSWSWSSSTTSKELLLVEQSSQVFLIDVARGPDETGKYKRWTIVEGRMSSDIAISGINHHPTPPCFPPWFPCKEPDQVYVAQSVAFVEFYHVHVVNGQELGAEDKLWAKPGNSTSGLGRLSLDGGHDISFSSDGKTLFWFLGPFLHSIQLSQVAKCAKAIEYDSSTFGIECLHRYVQWEEVLVEHTTDIARLKKDSRQALSKKLASAVRVQEPDTAFQQNEVSFNDADVLIIYNATLLTMESGHASSDLIPNGAIVSRGGVIESAGLMQDLVVPTGATVVDAQGAFLIPGFIDVHAHWDGFSSRYPATSWELETFLAYGVTTLHNPSADNVNGFVERFRVESGQLIGPRIFTVGNIIYGAGAAGYHQDIADTDEAHSALIRIKAEGGWSSISYKNYNLPSRASRQRLLLEARNLSMLCVPEGGMNQDWDLTYIIDGMTTVEHNLPVPVLHDDVMNLFALSGTGNTPTHIVNYGGAHGEQFVWAHVDVPNDPKLRQFTRHDILEQLTESTSRPLQSYALFNTSESVAKMVRRGLRSHIGAHGEPPLGLNYHAEMSFAKAGGLSNYEVLQAATSYGAETLGLHKSIGTLTPGKLADFLVFQPGADILHGDISQTQQLKFVARGGRLWEASTMEEVWPVKGRKQTIPPINAD